MIVIIVMLGFCLCCVLAIEVVGYIEKHTEKRNQEKK